jgi:hypothetical protein
MTKNTTIPTKYKMSFTVKTGSKWGFVWPLRCKQIPPFMEASSSLLIQKVDKIMLFCAMLIF